MAKSTPVPTKMQYVTRFGKLFREIANKTIEMATCYANAVSDYPELQLVLADKYPQVPQKTWDEYINVAEGRMHPRLIFVGCTAGRNVVQQLPVAEQERLVNGGTVDLLHADGTVEQVNPLTLGEVCVDRIYKKNDRGAPVGDVRTVDQQKKHMAVKLEKPADYIFKKGLCYVKNPSKGHDREALLALAEQARSRYQ